MPTNPQQLIALDIGERRIGAAKADTHIRFPVPLPAIQVDGTEIEAIARIIHENGATAVIIGNPRNQSGEETAQTQYVKVFAEKLRYLQIEIVFQDESLTSVLAEQHLKAQNKPYTKEDIDSHAAAIILSDYLEAVHAR